MSKLLVYFADGTWNGVRDDGHDDVDGGDLPPNATNVLKAFLWLEGARNDGSEALHAEMEKGVWVGGTAVQHAKYIHGVGDSGAKVVKALGGAFGIGTLSRVVRGYTYLSRMYEPGDRIVVVGFSRGAYTARALAGFVLGQGVMKRADAGADKEAAYQSALAAWYQYRSRSPTRSAALATLLDALRHPLARIRSRGLGEDEFVPVPRLEAVAVWDTVGSLGIPKGIDDGGQPLDAFRFVDTQLNDRVGIGLHALSIDEQREPFVHTRWDAAPNVRQVLFAGGHADVGGGFAEHGLSDVALDWMVGELRALGLRFAAQCPDPGFRPDPLATAHAMWLHDPWRLKKPVQRSFEGQGCAMHASVQQRMAAAGVAPDRGATAAKYAPTNLPPS